MAYTNNGSYRYRYFSVTKTIDGSTVSGYPKTYDIVDNPDFLYQGSQVTETELARFPEGDELTTGTYLNMLAAFKTYVEGEEAGLDVDNDQTNQPYGTNATWCVIA